MESITFVLLFLSKQVYEDQLKLNRESKAEKSENTYLIVSYQRREKLEDKNQRSGQEWKEKSRRVEKKKITKRVEGKQINKWVFIQEKNVLKKVIFTNNLMQNSFVVYLFQDY